MNRCSSTTELVHAWLRPPPETNEEQRSLANWFPINPAELQAEFFQFHRTLLRHGVQVTLLPTGKNPDSIYLYDSLLHTPWGVIIFLSQKNNRREESDEIFTYIRSKTNIPILGRISAPGYVDGGDLFWLSEKILAVGLSWRTNTEGLRQLQTFFAPFGVEVRGYDLPNLFGKNVCLHLMSLVSPLRENLALVYEPGVPIRLYEDLRRLGYKLICVPETEWDSVHEVPRLASNVLSLGKNRAISLNGNPITASRIRNEGITVIEIEAPNLCNAGTGGPTCLTLPTYRV